MKTDDPDYSLDPHERATKYRLFALDHAFQLSDSFSPSLALVYAVLALEARVEELTTELPMALQR